MIHLDTSFLIRALVRDAAQARTLRSWLETGEPIGMSVIAWTEFLCGPVGAMHVEMIERIVGMRLPFDEQDAATAAQLFNASGRRCGSLPDCMIAATAIRRGADLATTNPKHFRPFEAAGLRLIAAHGGG